MAFDPDNMTPEEREKYAQQIASNIDRLVTTFAELALPPGSTYVMIVGNDKGRIGAVFSNTTDREALLKMLHDTQQKLWQ